MMKKTPCPLCLSIETNLFYHSTITNLERDYLICCSCNLIFVPKEFHLSAAGQKRRYLQHNNDPEDPRYRNFLSALRDELTPHLRHGSKGIDYGSGPSPVLADMLKNDGFDMRTYDLFFQPDKSILSEQYYFVTCTETVEHFECPLQEFQTFNSLVKAGGWIGLMTSLFNAQSKFQDWYYHRDPTHIAFYSDSTMHFIAMKFGWEVLFPRQNIILFNKLV